MRVLLGVAVAALLLTGCSGSDDANDAPPATAPVTTAAVTTETPAAVDTPIDGHQVLSAVNVLQGFKAAKLPVRNDRYNDAYCESMKVGCIELLTTDDISIFTFADPTAQEVFAAAYGEEAFSSGNVVLSYAAARTPAALRPKYEKVLTGLK
jgi:hypothetical protein